MKTFTVLLLLIVAAIHSVVCQNDEGFGWEDGEKWEEDDEWGPFI